MKRVLGIVFLVAIPAVLVAQGGEAPPSTDPAALAFVDVVRVLQSPRCVNCHPTGDAPMVGDQGAPHPQRVSRDITKVGMSCQSCHRVTAVSTEPGMPPAVKGWGLPPKSMPMVFQNRTARQICETMKDPAQNGHKTLAELLHHVEADELVLYGWNPGGGRTLPPLSHQDFAAKFRTWVEAGAPCP